VREHVYVKTLFILFRVGAGTATSDMGFVSKVTQRCFCNDVEDEMQASHMLMISPVLQLYASSFNNTSACPV
jgi:hypothetical protein